MNSLDSEAPTRSWPILRPDVIGDISVPPVLAVGRRRSLRPGPVQFASGLVLFAAAWLLDSLVGGPLDFAGGYAFPGFVHVIYGALVLWGLRDSWLRSRKSPQLVLEGAPA